MVAWSCLDCRSSSSVFLSYSLGPTSSSKTKKKHTELCVSRAGATGAGENAKNCQTVCGTCKRAHLKLTLAVVVRDVEKKEDSLHELEFPFLPTVRTLVSFDVD
jgi:hypothetical protein